MLDEVPLTASRGNSYSRGMFDPNSQEEVIVLSKNGDWLSDGEEITHEPTLKLFSRSIKRDAQGYFLSVGRETKRIQVEDTPYFVHRIDGSSSDGYFLWVSGEIREKLDPQTLSYRPGRLCCRLQNGEEAKFLQAPYMELLKELQESGYSYFLTIEGRRIQLGARIASSSTL